MSESRATARFLRYSARKGRLIADMIRGLPASRALSVLRDTRRKAAAATLKLLKSALANAEDKHKLKPADLFVKTIMVDEGPTMKRIHARARGRADRIAKRTCHTTVVVAERS
ncbi:MAG: 50S ribosomal protein L22 [Candidatus Riflebacteria bacterium]|nr:50S ribosomal protein L22 [Candidatus Riflebacteria bacterium]